MRTRRGSSPDFIQLMARRGGLNVQLVRTKTWEESFAAGQRRQCDVFSLLMDSPSRRSFLDFTTPYLEIPGVIATSVKVPFVASLEQVSGKRLGHMRGFAGIELLRLQHPGIQLVEAGSYEEGLSRVQNGELYGFIGNMMSIGHVLQENKISDVKIAGRIGHDNLMSVATRNDEPMLHEVFQRLVDSIRPEERQEIMNHWLAVRFEQGFDYRLFWQVMSVVALIGVLTLCWATKLRRVNVELRAANQRLAEISRHDALTGLYNPMHFDDTIATTMHLCARNGLTMTLAMIDLDRFKEINDTFGDPFGDACLRHVAMVLRKSFRREIDQSVVALDGVQSRLTLSIGVWSGSPARKTIPGGCSSAPTQRCTGRREQGGIRWSWQNRNDSPPPAAQGRIRISTLRLSARPFSVSFVAIG